MNFTKFPRRHYLQGRTPVEFLPALTKALGKNVNVYIKRDDLLPGAAGGNKTRKLEFCMADALEKGADTIITCGAVQSNHARLTAAWSAKEGLECHLILEERVKESYNSRAGGNNFLFELLAVKSIEIAKGGSNIKNEMNKKAATLRAEGKKPYIIPGGASNAIGALGYAACAEEIMTQLNEFHLDIGHIVLASGSAGTHAGMVAGITGMNAKIPIIGVNVSRSKREQEEIVFQLACETAEKLGIKNGITREDVVCFDEYVGPGYSLPTDSMVRAVKFFAGTEAVLLDPVYSGKAAAGLIDVIQKEHFPKNSNVLFLHTGGTPALYEYMDVFRKF